MTEQKSKERTIMDNMIQECKNSYQSIKLSSLNEEAKERIIQILREERKKRFSEDDYQTILEKVKEEGKIPANELYKIVNSIMNDFDISVNDLIDWSDTFIEFVHEYISKEFWKKFTKGLPKNFKDLKENLIPFNVTDDEFATFLVWWKDCITYNWQKLNLWSKYDKLLKDKERIEEEINKETNNKIENNTEINKWHQMCLQLEKANMQCRAENPHHCEGFCETNNKKIEDIRKKIESEKATILQKVKNDLWYDELIEQIIKLEKSAFYEKYTYLKDLYNNAILPIWDRSKL